MSSKMITCKSCGAQIAASAKTCPQCGGKVKKPVYKRWWFIVLAVIIVCAVISSAMNDSSSSSSVSSQTASTSPAPTASASQETDSAEEAVTEAETEYPEAGTPIEPEENLTEYSVYSVSELMNDLENNALSASEKYKGQYVQITGRLGNIDSSGKYIDLYPQDNEWAFIGVTCYIKTDEQKSAVMNMSKDSTVTVRGKIKDVGEVLGYYLDIDEIL